MKVSRENLRKIIDRAKGKFIEQPSRIYWNDGGKEIKYDEKRIIAILESAGVELQLDLEIDYDKRT